MYNMFGLSNKTGTHHNRLEALPFARRKSTSSGDLLNCQHNYCMNRNFLIKEMSFEIIYFNRFFCSNKSRKNAIK